MKIFIAGSRRLSRLNADVRHRIDNIIEKGMTVLVGDANGADKAVQEYLTKSQYSNVEVFCMEGFCRNNVGAWPARHIVAADPSKRNFAYFSTKDRAMAAEASHGLMLWDGESRGTFTNIVTLVRQAKPVVVYFSPNKMFHNIRESGDVTALLQYCDPTIRRQFEAQVSEQLGSFEVAKLGIAQRLPLRDAAVDQLLRTSHDENTAGAITTLVGSGNTAFDVATHAGASMETGQDLHRLVESSGMPSAPTGSKQTSPDEDLSETRTLQRVRATPGSQLRRGSRRHVLDLVGRPDFVPVMNGLLAPVEAALCDDAPRRPLGESEPQEYDVRSFCREYPPMGVELRALKDWWVAEEFTGPTWDLLAQCSVAGRPGLLLMEAKAHESELDWGGKRLAIEASAQAKANHARIEKCIAEAEKWYRRTVSAQCHITATSHYQLANRLAAAEVLARCGVNAILVYVGFTGDTYFSDYLRGETHWHRCMGAYLHGVLPLSWTSTRTQHEGGGSVSLVVAALPVARVSSA
jgi:hypothetical protein